MVRVAEAAAMVGVDDVVEVGAVAEVGGVAEAVKAEGSVEVMAARAVGRQAIEGRGVGACDE
jgi:hypothetical protein